jgi:hypothetical protein
MGLLLIQLPSTPTIYNTRGVYTNLYTTDVVTGDEGERIVESEFCGSLEWK